MRVNAVSPRPIGDTKAMAQLAPNAEYVTAGKRRIALRDGGSELGDAGGDALTVPQR